MNCILTVYRSIYGLRFLLIPGMAGLIVIGIINMILTPIGLYEAQKQLPHAFDNSIVSYDSLWFFVSIFPILFFALCIGVIGLVVHSYKDKSKSTLSQDRHQENQD